MRHEVVLVACLLMCAGSRTAQAVDINGYPAPAGSYTGGSTGAFAAMIHEADPGADRVSGEAAFSFQFKVPVFPPPTTMECDPAAPVVKPGECNHACVKKDGYILYQSEPLAGIPVIWLTPTCEAPVAGPITPIDTATARKTCVSKGAWGGTTTATVRLKVGPLYHFNQPRTTRTATGWSYQNDANLVWPNVVLEVPVIIQCVGGLELSQLAARRLVRRTPSPQSAMTAPTTSAVAPGPPRLGLARQTAVAQTEYEAEALLRAGAVQVSGGEAHVQSMTAFGSGWSGDEQLFWSGGTEGATLELSVGVPATAKYVVEIYMTRAPDYGQLRFDIDDQRSAMSFDGMAPYVMASGPQQLGTVALRAGNRRLRLTIAGRHAEATGYYVGIDKLRLYPAGPID